MTISYHLFVLIHGYTIVCPSQKLEDTYGYNESLHSE